MLLIDYFYNKLWVLSLDNYYYYYYSYYYYYYLECYYSNSYFSVKKNLFYISLVYNDTVNFGCIVNNI